MPKADGIQVGEDAGRLCHLAAEGRADSADLAALASGALRALEGLMDRPDVNDDQGRELATGALLMTSLLVWYSQQRLVTIHIRRAGDPS